MTWYKVTYQSGKTEFLNDEDPVNKHKIEVLRRNMRTAGPIAGAMGQAGNTPSNVERSSEAAAKRAAGR